MGSKIILHAAMQRDIFIVSMMAMQLNIHKIHLIIRYSERGEKNQGKNKRRQL